MKNDISSGEWLSVIERVTGDAILYDLLKYCPLAILRSWRLSHVEPGRVICRQGDICDEFHLIVQGEVDIFIHTEDGRKYQQARYAKGDMLGELEIFEQRPYICSVEAVTEVTLLTLPRSEFCSWLSLDNHFNQKILQSFSRQYYRLSKKAGEDSLFSLHQRVCQALWQRYQSQNSTEVRRIIKVDKAQLSAEFAATARSINRILFELREQQVIRVSGDQIEVLDPHLLRQQVER